MPTSLFDLTVAVHEAIDTTGGIDERALTCVEGVRGVRDFDLYHGVGLAFELHGVVGLCRGFREEHIAVGHVAEDDGAIVFGMDAFFHCLIDFNR